MVTCSRCGQQVDEATRTTCPVCFTPLPQASGVPPQMPYAAVSVPGEVPGGVQPGMYAGPSGPLAPGMAPPPQYYNPAPGEMPPNMSPASGPVQPGMMPPGQGYYPQAMPPGMVPQQPYYQPVPGQMPPNGMPSGPMYPGMMPPSGPMQPGMMPPSGPMQPQMMAPSGPMQPMVAPSGPLAASRSAAALAPGARVSLTGEVIKSQDSSPPPRYVGGGAAPGGPPAAARRPGSGPTKKTATVADLDHMNVKPSKSTTFYMVMAILCVFLAGGAVYGGIFAFTHYRTNPKTQADRYLAALKTMDLNTLYDTTAINPIKFPNAKVYASKVNEKTQKQVKNLLSTVDFQTGTPVITNDDATIPVTVSGTAVLEMSGKKFTIPLNAQINMEMHNYDGLWKVVPTSFSYNSIRNDLTTPTIPTAPTAPATGSPKAP